MPEREQLAVEKVRPGEGIGSASEFESASQLKRVTDVVDGGHASGDSSTVAPMHVEFPALCQNEIDRVLACISDYSTPSNGREIRDLLARQVDYWKLSLWQPTPGQRISPAQDLENRCVGWMDSLLVAYNLPECRHKTVVRR